MKKALYVAVVAILFSVNSYAEEQIASPKIEQVSRQLGITIEEATKLVNNVREFALIMGLKPAPEKTSKEEEENLTGPEVANKALDMAGNAVSVISAQIEKAAPEVWRIMIKQQYANGVAIVLLPFGLLIASLIYSKTANKWKCDNRELSFACYDFTLAGLRAISRFVAFFTSTLWLVIALSVSIRHLINPEYYAIRDMFKIVLGLS